MSEAEVCYVARKKKNNSHLTYSCLKHWLGIMGDKLRAPLKSRNTIALRLSEGFQDGPQLSPMSPVSRTAERLIFVFFSGWIQRTNSFRKFAGQLINQMRRQ